MDRLEVEGGQGRDGCEGQCRGWDGKRGWKEGISGEEGRVENSELEGRRV